MKKIDEKIRKFEKKYGMEFKDFKTALRKNEINNKYSYDVERDFWEWEGLITLKNRNK